MCLNEELAGAGYVKNAEVDITAATVTESAKPKPLRIPLPIVKGSFYELKVSG